MLPSAAAGQLQEGGCGMVISGSKVEFDQDDEIRIIAEKAKQNGFKAYIVGGFVRDLFLGRTSKDIDIVISTIPDISQINQKVLDVVKDKYCDDVDFDEFMSTCGGGIIFAIILALEFNLNLPAVFFRTKTAKINFKGIEIEFAHARSESYQIKRIGEQQTKVRQPETKMSDIFEDVIRRDFTINTLMIDLETFKILDLTGRGIDDLTKGILHVANSEDPIKVFSDDPLRIWRAVRFVSQLGFYISGETCRAIDRAMAIDEVFHGFKLAPDDPMNMPETFKGKGKTSNVKRNLDIVEPMAYSEEFFKLITGKYAYKAMNYLFSFCMIPYISRHLLFNLNKFDIAIRFLDEILPPDFNDVEQVFMIRIAYLFRSCLGTGYGLETDGLVPSLCLSQLGFGNSLISKIVDDIECPMFPQDPRENSVFKWARDITKFDRGVCESEKEAQRIASQDFLRRKCLLSYFCDPKDIDDVLVSGFAKGRSLFREIIPMDVVMKELGINSGPIVGKIKQHLEDSLVDMNFEQQLESAISFLEKINGNSENQRDAN